MVELAAKTIGQGVISNLTTDICSLLRRDTLTELLEELDLEFDLEFVELLIKSIKEDNEMTLFCKKEIIRIMEKIKEELEIIQLKIIDKQYAYTLTRWTHSYQENLENLKKYKNILNNRKDTLIKIL